MSKHYPKEVIREIALNIICELTDDDLKSVKDTYKNNIDYEYVITDAFESGEIPEETYDMLIDIEEDFLSVLDEL